MKKLSLLLIYICGTICTGLLVAPVSVHASDVHTPGPAYPNDARKANITGTGTCQVVFDSSGHVNAAVMTKSTGSTILDDNTVSYAKKHWTGKPNTKVSVPIFYKLVPAKPPKDRVQVSVPMPPYPYQARAHHEQGRGIVKVIFDERGHAVSAAMTTSTGSGILDDNTVNYALKEWKSSGGKRTTISVPVAYRLQ